jgi:hypothetical protein
MYVRDLGVVECDLSDGATPSKKKLKRRTTRRKPAEFDRRDLAAWIRLARELQAMLDSGRYMNRTRLAEALGISADEVRRILDMQRLAPAIQERILASRQELYVPWRRMRRVLEEANHVRQQEMLADVLESIDGSDAANQSSTTTCQTDEDTSQRDSGQFPATSCQLRLVIYFNPELFVRQRLNGRKRLRKLNGFIKKLNEELISTSRSRAEEPVRRRIMRELEKNDSVRLFDVSVAPIDVTSKSGDRLRSFHCELKLRNDKWRLRRRYDGFILLVGHPDLGMSGEELVRLFYAKDLIEKDFQSIKSVLKLRPIYSYTDAKVEAHVTVCMLSLVLQRALEHRLRNATPPLSFSAPACREVLSTCHLNHMKHSAAGRSFYSVTEATQAQREILHPLEMLGLVEDQAVAQALAPRVV